MDDTHPNAFIMQMFIRHSDRIMPYLASIAVHSERCTKYAVAINERREHLTIYIDALSPRTEDIVASVGELLNVLDRADADRLKFVMAAFDEFEEDDDRVLIEV